MRRLILLASLALGCVGERTYPGDVRPVPDDAGSRPMSLGPLLDHDCGYVRTFMPSYESEAVRQQCLQNRAILELAAAVRALADRPVAIPSR